MLRRKIVPDHLPVGARLVGPQEDETQIERDVRLLITEGHGDHGKRIADRETIDLQAQRVAPRTPAHDHHVVVPAGLTVKTRARKPSDTRPHPEEIDLQFVSL